MSSRSFFSSVPVEEPNSSSGSDGIQQQNSVLYVAPLRIVAPPGVPPYLPHSFDPLTAFNGLRREPYQSFRNGGHAPCSSDPPTRDDLGHFRPGFYQAPHDHAGSSCSANESGGAHPIENAFDNGAPSPKGETGTPAFSPFLSGIFNNKARASAVRDLPFGCSSRSSFLTELSNDLSVDGDLAPKPSKQIREPKPSRQIREPKPKRSSPAKRPRPLSEGTSGGMHPHKAVTNVLRLYDALRRNLLLEEERKNKDANKGSRPDLLAGSVINSRGLAVNRGQKLIGSIPGIEVGDQFYFRMEICCTGLHGPIQAGIEYVTAKESEYKSSVAISIISSGGYDAKDDGEVLVYTGQGGKSSVDNRKPTEDQKLERGNLAMEGSMKHQVPVRVTRGIKDSASPSGKTYTYDGLYMVEECWSEKGKFGFEEFKFKLRRIPGQPELGSAFLKLSNTLKYRPGEREGLRIIDIANGKEGVPVCVVNSVNSEQGPPAFDYSTSVYYPHETDYQRFGQMQGCNCEGVCNSQECSCCVANGGVFPYLTGGVLVRERGLIYECGSNCKCSFGCKNRLTQRAVKYRLEVFMTQDRGWGLRSWDSIPAGSFLCEYTGKLVQDPHSLSSRDHVLDLSRLPVNDPAWGDVSNYLDAQAAQMASHVPRADTIIDASQAGCASRFINHSCSPNVVVQCVLRDHQDTKRPHVMLFAMDNIPPFRELTIDYGSGLPTSEHQITGKPCLCKSEDCKGTFYQ